MLGTDFGAIYFSPIRGRGFSLLIDAPVKPDSARQLQSKTTCQDRRAGRVSNAPWWTFDDYLLRLGDNPLGDVYSTRTRVRPPGIINAQRCF